MKKFKFKPNKMVDSGTFTNKQRSDRSIDVLAFSEYRKNGNKRVGKTVEYDHAVDLIADIGHLADRAGWDFDAILRIARMHWEYER